MNTHELLVLLTLVFLWGCDRKCQYPVHVEFLTIVQGDTVKVSKGKDTLIDKRIPQTFLAADAQDIKYLIRDICIESTDTIHIYRNNLDTAVAVSKGVHRSIIIDGHDSTLRIFYKYYSQVPDSSRENTVPWID